jgi:hypothetical protein
MKCSTCGLERDEIACYVPDGINGEWILCVPCRHVAAKKELERMKTLHLQAVNGALPDHLKAFREFF